MDEGRRGEKGGDICLMDGWMDVLEDGGRRGCAPGSGPRGGHDETEPNILSTSADPG